MDAEGTTASATSPASSSFQKWSLADDQLLVDLVRALLPLDGVLRTAHWKKLAASFPGRSHPAIQSYWYQITHADASTSFWLSGPKRASKKSAPYHSHAPNSNAWKKSPISVRTVGPQRSRKSSSQLSPKAQKWTPEDDDLLHKLVSDPQRLDKKYDWEEMAQHFVGRTANATMDRWYKYLRAKSGTSGVLYNFESPQFLHDDGTGVEKMDIEDLPEPSASRDQLGVLQDHTPAPASSLTVVVEDHTWSKEHLKTLRSLATDRKAPWSEIGNECGGRTKMAARKKWEKMQKTQQTLQAHPAPNARTAATPPANATHTSPHPALESADASALKVILNNPRYLNESTIAAPSSPPIPIASSASSDATAPPAGPSTAPPASPSNPASSELSYPSISSTEALPASSSAPSQAVAPPAPLPASQDAAFAGLDNARAAMRRITERMKARSEASE